MQKLREFLSIFSWAPGLPSWDTVSLWKVRKVKKAGVGNNLLTQLLGDDCQEKFDEFDLCQLARVVEVCRESKSRAEAGKKLFAVSRKQRNTTNDSDRLGKYLEKFGLTFQKCKDC